MPSGFFPADSPQDAKHLERIGVVGIQLQSLVDVVFRLREIPIDEEPDRGDSVMGLGKPAVELQRCLGSDICSWKRLPGWHAEKVSEQRPGIGHHGVGGGISGIDCHSLLKILDGLALSRWVPSVPVEPERDLLFRRPLAQARQKLRSRACQF
jgi:hypothetical protein